MPALGNRGPEPGRRIPAPRRAPAPPPRHEHPPPAWKGPAGVTGTTSAPGRAAPRPKPKPAPSPVGVHGSTRVGERVIPIHSHADLMAALSQRRGVHGAVTAPAVKKAGLNVGVPGLATINALPLAQKLATLKVPGAGGIAGRLLNEAIDIPGQTFLSGAVAGSAARSAAEGKPQALKDLGGNVLSQVEHPLRSFKEAPLNTALLFAGGENLIGRLAGRVARTGALGERASRASALARPDLKLYNEEALTGRKYNPDVLRQAAQKAYERKVLPNLPEGEVRLGRYASGKLRQADPFQAEGFRLKRHTVGGLVRAGQVDYIRPAGERTRRGFVKPNVEALEAARPAHGEGAVSMIAQGIITHPHHLEEQLTAEANRLRAAQKGTNVTGGRPPKGKDLADNKAAVEHVEALLSDKHFLANPEEAFHAAEVYKRLLGPLTAKRLAHGDLLPEQLSASLLPYAQTQLKASRFSPEGKLLPRLVGPGGQELSHEDILRHMGENGVSVAHVTHRERGNSAFYQPTTKMPTLEGYERTGAALEKGTVNHSFEHLKASLANNASKVAQAEVRTRELNRLTVGRFKNRRAAEAGATNLSHDAAGNELRPGLGKLVPVFLGPKQILEKGAVEPVSLRATLRRYGLEEHTPTVQNGQGQWALIPEKVQHRLQAHDSAVSARGEGKRLAQMYTQGFRKAKLYTSTRHVAGVAQELGIRLAAENTLPRPLGGQQGRLGRLSRIHLEALAEDHGPLGPRYRELNDALGSRGSLYTATQDNDIVRKATRFAESSSRGFPTPAKAWRAYYKTLQKGMHKVEQGAYDPLLGKAIGEFMGGWRNALKDQDLTMTRLENLTPAEADSIARRVDDMMGNWSHQPPEVRRAVQTYSPFGLWWLNSMRWLYRLPVTHPVKTAIAAALYNATKQTRSSEGQGYGAPHPVPGFLTGTINATLPGLGRGKINPTYYSPMGVATEPTTVAAEQIFPQLNSIIAAAKGENPLTGERLTDAHGKDIGELSKILNVATEVAAGPAPGATQLQQVLQGGGKPYGTANLVTDLLERAGGPAQVKPHTRRSPIEVAAKIVTPTRFNFPSSHAASGGGLGPVESGPSGLTPREQRSLRRVERASEGLTPRERRALKRRSR